MVAYVGGRALDVHAVAARVVELREAYEAVNLLDAPAGDDRRREVLRDVPHRLPHLVHASNVKSSGEDQVPA